MREALKGPLYSTGNYIQYLVITYNGKESETMCVWITESLCCIRESNITLWIKCTSLFKSSVKSTSVVKDPRGCNSWSLHLTAVWLGKPPYLSEPRFNPYNREVITPDTWGIKWDSTWKAPGRLENSHQVLGPLPDASAACGPGSDASVHWGGEQRAWHRDNIWTRMSN